MNRVLLSLLITIAFLAAVLAVAAGNVALILLYGLAGAIPLGILLFCLVWYSVYMEYRK